MLVKDKIRTLGLSAGALSRTLACRARVVCGSFAGRRGNAAATGSATRSAHMGAHISTRTDSKQLTSAKQHPRTSGVVQRIVACSRGVLLSEPGLQADSPLSHRPDLRRNK